MRDKADEVEARVAVDCSTFDRVLMYLEASARGQARNCPPAFEFLAPQPLLSLPPSARGQARTPHPASAFGPATTPAFCLTGDPTFGRGGQGDAFTFDANSLEDVAEAARALGCRPLAERTAQATRARAHAQP